MIAFVVSPQISGAGDLQHSLTVTTVAVIGFVFYLWCFLWRFATAVGKKRAYAVAGMVAAGGVGVALSPGSLPAVGIIAFGCWASGWGSSTPSIRVAAGALPAATFLAAVMLTYPLTDKAFRRMIADMAERRAAAALGHTGQAATTVRTDEATSARVKIGLYHVPGNLRVEQRPAPPCAPRAAPNR